LSRPASLPPAPARRNPQLDFLSHPNLGSLVGSHTVKGKVTSAQFGQSLTTINGKTLTISGDMVEGASLSKKDIAVDNGVIHAVSAVFK